MYKYAIKPSVILLIIWIIYFIHILFPTIQFVEYALFPRSIKNLYGILTMHFIHTDFYHILHNSIPLFVLLWLLNIFYNSLFNKVFWGIILISGFWVWISARPSFHLGASALVYGLCSFIFFSGIFRKYALLIRISLLVVFLYGSMFWGIFPMEPNISWEGHLFGALSGLLMAWVFKHEGPQKPKYDWEINDHDDQEIEYWKVE